MAINKLKYKNAILYFIKYCKNQYLGDTKLNKLLYYLDFINYRDRKKSVTGDLYISNHYGPTPEKLLGILSEMKSSGEIETIEGAFKGSHSTTFISKKNPNEKVFTEKELNLLKSICKEFLDWSTDKIVEQTHLEAPWFYSKLFDKVDYNYSADIEFFKN